MTLVAGARDSPLVCWRVVWFATLHATHLAPVARVLKAEATRVASGACAALHEPRAELDQWATLPAPSASHAASVAAAPAVVAGSAFRAAASIAG